MSAALTPAGFDRHEKLSLLGKGGFGSVHKALDRETGQVVALKALHSMSADDLWDLKREFRVLAGLSHPNLVQLHDLVVDDHQSYFTMELIEGPSFSAFVSGSEARLRHAFDGIAAALGALHQSGITHRDMKPSNVLIAEDDRVVLVDFGLATAINRHQSQAPTAGLAGTLNYMAPEALWGDSVTPASDWYSAGLMLFEVLTGKLPHADLSPAELIQARNAAPLRPSSLVRGVPEDLDELAVALLDPSPERRPNRTGFASIVSRTPEQRALPPIQAAETFVGRRRELELLAEDTDRSCMTSVLSVVRGESGIGKSALVQEHRQRVRNDPSAWVLQTRCHPYETVAYKAMDGLIDDLSRRLVHLEDNELLSLAPRHAAALGRLFPVLDRVPFPRQANDAETFAEAGQVRRRGIGALRELLARIGDRRTLVMWIDDGHWGDPESAALLDALLAPPDPPPVHWIVSLRSDVDEEGSFPSQIAAIFSREQNDGHSLHLTSMSAEECQSLLRIEYPELASDGERALQLVRECQGLPLFLGELARSHRRDDSRGATRLTELVESRLEALSTDENKVMEALAVLGGAVSSDLLAEFAGMASLSRRVSASLEQDRLVRTVAVEGRIGFEPYHDRIRESSIARIPPDQLRKRHLEAGRILTARGGADSERLYTHFSAGGDLESATRHCVLAADSAARQLAFDRAAELYRESLSMGTPLADPKKILPRLGEVLAQGGRGLESAEAFGMAAEALPSGSLARGRYLRRVAEQYLISGYLDEGKEVLRPLASDLGVAYPTSPSRAFFRAGLGMARLALRGTRYRPCEESDIDRRRLDQVDLCYAAARGLLAVDSMRGAYFNVEGARLALRYGEPVRVGECLALVGGGALGAAGGLLARWGQRMIDHAKLIAEDREAPRLKGNILVGEGQLQLFAGRWGAALESSDEGVRLLTERCRGAGWECNIGRMAALRALEELGRLRELGLRAREWKEEAILKDDRYGEVTARLNHGLACLAEGNVAQAREEALRVVERWSRDGYHVQHLYALRLNLYSDLYEGNAGEAWSRLQNERSEIENSFLLRFPLGRLDFDSFAGRLALRIACERTSKQNRYFDVVESHARRLAKEGRPEFSAHAGALRAGLARIRGDLASSMQLLESAANDFDSCGMSLYGGAARIVLGRLSSDSLPPARYSIDVADPDRWIGLLFPALA